MPLSPLVAAVGSSWRSLSPNVRGALWLLLSTMLFAAVNGVVRGLGGTLHSTVIAFFRCFFGLLVILPFLMRRGVLPFATEKLWLHFLRIAVGVGGMLTSFYAMAHLPLATAVSLTFTKPLFMIVLAVLFLGETVRWRRSVATVIGFGGVIVMVDPFSGLSLEAAFIWGLISAMLLAAVLVCIKILSNSEKPVTMLFYFTLGAMVGTFIPATFVWSMPTWGQLCWMAFMGSAASAGQYFAVRAYRVAEATAITPIDYCQLLFSGLIGFIIFNEIPSTETALGAAIIVASTFYIVNREARMRRVQKQELKASLPVASISSSSTAESEKKEKQIPPSDIPSSP